MAGNKLSGRHKGITKLVREALEENDRNFPMYLRILDSIAQDIKADLKLRADICFYLVDRSQGKAKSTTDLRVKAQTSFSPDEIAFVTQLAINQGRRMLSPIVTDVIPCGNSIGEVTSETSVTYLGVTDVGTSTAAEGEGNSPEISVT